MEDPSVQKAKKTLLILGLVVVILLAMLCSGLFLATRKISLNSNSKKDKENQPTPTVSINAPTPTIQRIWMPFVEDSYLFKTKYLSTWQISNDTDNGDKIVFKAKDGSSLGINWEKKNYKYVEDYLMFLDIGRSTNNDGLPSVTVEWSKNFDITNNTIVQRRERNLVKNETLIKSYLLEDNYIFVFTVYSSEEADIETSEMFLEMLNVIGNFQFKMDRFEARGRVVTGSDAGKVYCTEGIYLEVEGDFVNPRDRYLLLRSMTTTQKNDYPLFTNKSYIGSRVSIESIYDTSKVLCGEFSCECEDYLLVESITRR